LTLRIAWSGRHPLMRLVDQHLIVRTVEVVGIQQIDSSVERGLNRRDALSTILPGWLAVAVGHPMHPRPIADTVGPDAPS
jgi:hypothetical protein